MTMGTHQMLTSVLEIVWELLQDGLVILVLLTLLLFATKFVETE